MKDGTGGAKAGDEKLGDQNWGSRAEEGKHGRRDEGRSGVVTMRAFRPPLATCAYTNVSPLPQFSIPRVTCNRRLECLSHCLVALLSLWASRYSSARIVLLQTSLQQIASRNFHLYLSSNRVLEDPFTVIPSPVLSLGNVINDDLI